MTATKAAFRTGTVSRTEQATKELATLNLKREELEARRAEAQQRVASYRQERQAALLKATDTGEVDGRLARAQLDVTDFGDFIDDIAGQIAGAEQAVIDARIVDAQSETDGLQVVALRATLSFYQAVIAAAETGTEALVAARQAEASSIALSRLNGSRPLPVDIFGFSEIATIAERLQTSGSWTTGIPGAEAELKRLEQGS